MVNMYGKVIKLDKPVKKTIRLKTKTYFLRLHNYNTKSKKYVFKYINISLCKYIWILQIEKQITHTHIFDCCVSKVKNKELQEGNSF